MEPKGSIALLHYDKVTGFASQTETLVYDLGDKDTDEDDKILSLLGYNYDSGIGGLYTEEGEYVLKIYTNFWREASQDTAGRIIRAIVEVREACSDFCYFSTSDIHAMVLLLNHLAPLVGCLVTEYEREQTRVKPFYG